MRRKRPKVEFFDSLGKKTSLKKIREGAREQKDAFLQSAFRKAFVIHQKILSKKDIEKFTALKVLNPVLFEEEIYLNKEEVKECLRLQNKLIR